MATLQVVAKGKVWDKESIQELLERNDKAVERAISLIFSYQTFSEQNRGIVNTKNGVGFNRNDTQYFTRLAINLKYGKHLTPTQMLVSRRKIKKYANQILRIMAKQQ